MHKGQAGRRRTDPRSSAPAVPCNRKELKMDEGRQERLQKLFKSTLLLASDLRTAYLDRECGIDIDLRREIEVLLLGEKSTEVLHTTVAGGARFPDREPEFTGNDR